MTRLALGTVQFGLDYGIANTTGRVPLAEVSEILSCARHAGLDTLDTAVAYGHSEETLGQLGVGSWKVVTKLPAMPEGIDDVRARVKREVTGSLRRLRLDRLHGLLLHKPSVLLGPAGPALLSTLKELQADGLVKMIGVSVYDPEELEQLYEPGRYDIVQAPINILDRRMVDTGWTQRLADEGVEIHSRSTFLQGLLLMDDRQRPSRFSRWSTTWVAWRHWLDETGLTPL